MTEDDIRELSRQVKGVERMRMADREDLEQMMMRCTIMTAFSLCLSVVSVVLVTVWGLA